MARGRMLNKSVSSDKDVATLVNELGAEAGLVFTWLIAHLDREGRMHGDPEVIKGLVFPRIAGITPAIIRQTAARAHGLGLVVWYESDGDLYLAMPGFEKNQPGMRKDREPESSFPAPASDVSREALPDGCRQTADKTPPEVKVKGSRSNNTVGLATDHADDVLEVFAHYRTFHPRAHPKPSSKSKEWRLVRDRLVEGYTVAALKQAVDGHHKSKHHLGENDRRTKYLSLELCMRDSSKVNGFIELADPGAAATSRPAPMRNVLPDAERVKVDDGVEQLRKLREGIA